MKNYLTTNLQVITVRGDRVVFSESLWDYLWSWFSQGLTINFTDSSQYRSIKPKGIPLPIKESLYQ